VEHPLRLVLLRRDVPDHVLVEATARGGAGHVGVGPAIFVAPQPGQLFSLGHRVILTVFGMCVVHTPSPLAMVASRWTCVPTRREMTWVSASHNCGNSAA